MSWNQQQYPPQQQPPQQPWQQNTYQYPAGAPAPGVVNPAYGQPPAAYGQPGYAAAGPQQGYGYSQAPQQQQYGQPGLPAAPHTMQQYPVHQSSPAFGSPPYQQPAVAYPGATPPAPLSTYSQPAYPAGQFHQPGGPPQPFAATSFYLGAQLAVDPLNPLLPIPLELPGYNPSSDVDAIKKATKGFGTDENALNRILCLRAANQIQVLAQAYKSRYGKDLIDLLKKETSGDYERTLCALAMGPVDSDVHLLHEAIAGAGTKESLVTELLVGRHPNELVILRHAFEKQFHKSMDKEVLDDLSLKTKDAFAIVLQGRWHDNGQVNQSLLGQDLQQLLPAFRHGFTDEMLICSILFARSPLYLQALVPAFKQRNGKSLTKEIKQHFNGHLQDALLFAVEGGKRDGLGIWRDAKRLEGAMSGAGTADVLLIARVTRGHWDRNRFEQIKLAYQQKYKKPLSKRVQGETSGHYRDCLLTIINGK